MVTFVILITAHLSKTFCKSDRSHLGGERIFHSGKWAPEANVHVSLNLATYLVTLGR